MSQTAPGHCRNNKKVTDKGKEKKKKRRKENLTTTSVEVEISDG